MGQVMAKDGTRHAEGLGRLIVTKLQYIAQHEGSLLLGLQRAPDAGEAVGNVLAHLVREVRVMKRGAHIVSEFLRFETAGGEDHLRTFSPRLASPEVIDGQPRADRAQPRTSAPRCSRSTPYRPH
jgi:hypothetical protein